MRYKEFLVLCILFSTEGWSMRSLGDPLGDQPNYRISKESLPKDLEGSDNESIISKESLPKDLEGSDNESIISKKSLPKDLEGSDNEFISSKLQSDSLESNPEIPQENPLNSKKEPEARKEPYKSSLFKLWPKKKEAGFPNEDSEKLTAEQKIPNDPGNIVRIFLKNAQSFLSNDPKMCAIAILATGCAYLDLVHIPNSYIRFGLQQIYRWWGGSF